MPPIGTRERDQRRRHGVVVAQARDHSPAVTGPPRSGLLTQRPVGPTLVVVSRVLGQHLLEMAATEDQHPVETLTTDSADEALGEGIGLWCYDWVRMIRAPSASETSSKRDVNLVSGSRTGNRTGCGPSASTMLRFLAT